MKLKIQEKYGGFTLVEVVVGSAIFLIVAIAAYGAFTSLFKLINLAQYQEMAIAVANEEMETIRNMPYADVGVVGSISPSGNVPYQQSVVRGGIPFLVTTIIRNIDLPADGLAGGTPNDTNPADNKMISITVSCTSCGNTQPLTITGQVGPLALENTGNTGSLFIRVRDAIGHPIQGANVTVTSTGGTIHDVSDDTGLLALVGIPPGTNAYHIVVTKQGYSTDQTYSPGQNVVNPDSNVVSGQVTDAYFTIDKLASLSISSVSPTCEPKGNYHFDFTGSKVVDSNVPGTPKYHQSLVTDSGGLLNFPSFEWDTGGYIAVTSSGETVYDLAGINPVNPVVLNPGSAVNLQFTVVPRNPNSLMVSVLDNSGLPLPGATVDLKDGSGNIIFTKITGQGSISQSDWTGGANQSTINGYSSASNVDDSGGDIKLFHDIIGGYRLSGVLDSATFDTGTTSNFNTLQWTPAVQSSASTSVTLQFAASPDAVPVGGWQFNSPGYSTSGGSLNIPSNRYVRYRVNLDTIDTNYSSVVSDIGFTYTSGCIPPGQVLFQGLSQGNYTLTVSLSGYTTQSDVPVSISSGWSSDTIKLQTVAP